MPTRRRSVAARAAVAAAIAALAAFGAFTLERLGGALEALRSVDALAAAATAARNADESAPRAPAPAAIEPAPDSASLTERAESRDGPSSEPALGTDAFDEHIRRWLAQDPEFRRAADELLQDPDPQVRREALELLRGLGALDER